MKSSKKDITTSLVHVVEKLDETGLQRLALEDVLAIHVKNFISRELVDCIAQKILTSGFERYINAPSIGRIGMAFYETESQPELVETYFKTALENINDLRQRCTPYASPIDTLRCTLDEVWPAGANLETLYGRKMFIGLSRVVEPEVHFLAHHDIFAKDAPDAFRAHSLQSQFACNVYLDMPLKGGELQIWEKELTPQEFDDIRGNSYGVDPSFLGNPSLQIKPDPGDLIIFNSRKMHAVAPGVKTPRLSLSSFIGYRGQHQPLTYWS
jgi:Rps23 Pro-64 3,4-dihydroxylase Tpa1-like proline 4-hydroxylase